ncbi:MAG: hypothetical protein UT15_C0009G0011 [Berkelbacteria bacterium GW2011_GWA1_39_10]|uniref:Uncharacterized protein n=1 Tax=Berkelbacteria bacterium GW2011_GWA1_39_10 TaxID=1618332 RepID=A0A0G0LRF2_9BACT|nr:MAG: hypothetical protein UT15_C0009G0011 [Berkelbacteria bacterium GW2011_GWA1_39_10]
MTIENSNPSENIETPNASSAEIGDLERKIAILEQALILQNQGLHVTQLKTELRSIGEVQPPNEHHDNGFFGLHLHRERNESNFNERKQETMAQIQDQIRILEEAEVIEQEYHSVAFLRKKIEELRHGH